MGEKEASHSEKGEKKKEEGAKTKKEDGSVNVVLKFDLHCEGCARKVRRAVKGFAGVETVTTEFATNKLTVVGNVDPWKIRDLVESRAHKKVDLVSPNVPRKEEKPKEEKPKEEKKTEEKKPKEPVVSTVLLKIRLHCEGCIRRIDKIIRKVKGVDDVTIHKEKDEVTVKGTMDLNALPEYLTQKLKRSVTIVAPKKVDGGGEKDKKKVESGGEKEKKKEEKKEESPIKEVSKMEHHAPSSDIGGSFHPYPQVVYAYHHEPFHAPQYFSDENPNACSVM